jgi:Uma2 family endonuclease
MVEAIAPPHEKLITGDELYEMVGVGPCELIDGRIVPMSPTGNEHGGVELTIAETIKGFVRQKKLGKVRSGEVGIYTHRDPDRVRAADVLYISDERYARRTKSRGYLDVAPDLVVEVLSPGDAVMDLTQKLREYFAIGVRLVWVADPEARLVYAYRSLTDIREFKETDILVGDDVLPGFEAPVATLFED